MGLTPEQVVAAAAAVRAVAGNKRLLMQASDIHSKMTMMYKEGLWLGNDINQSVSTTFPDYKYVSGTFPLPEQGLRMLATKKVKTTGTQSMLPPPEQPTGVAQEDMSTTSS